MAESADKSTGEKSSGGDSTIAEHKDPFSPYYLSHSDNSTSGATTLILNGNNYHTWKQELMMNLNIRNKAGFVEGTLVKPGKDETNEKAWKKCDTLVLSWIHQSVSSEIRSTILYCEKSKEAWDILKIRYAEPSDIKIFSIEQDINKIEQGSSSVGEYFTKLNVKWEELKHFEPIPSCSCGHCKCSLNSEYQKLLEKRKIFKFLMSLNDSYDFIRGKIIAQEPLPELNKVYGIVLTEERQKLARSLMSSQAAENEASALAVGYKKKLYCTNCHMTNHTYETCYKIHGYPNENNKRAMISPRGGGRFGRGRGRGRFADQRFLHSGLHNEAFNEASSSAVQVTNKPEMTNPAGRVVNSFSNDQMQVLLAMAEKFKNDSKLPGSPLEPASNCAGTTDKSLQQILDEDWSSE